MVVVVMQGDCFIVWVYVVWVSRAGAAAGGGWRGFGRVGAEGGRGFVGGGRVVGGRCGRWGVRRFGWVFAWAHHFGC